MKVLYSLFILLLCSSQAYAQRNDLAIATVEAKQGQLEEDLQKIRGDFERVQHESSSYKKRLDQVQGDYEFRFQQQEKMIQQLEDSLQKAKDSIHDLQEKFSQLGKAGPSVVSPSSDKQTEKLLSKLSEPPVPTIKPIDSIQEQYEKAYSLYLAANYQESEEAMARFIDEHGDNDLVGNAHFWLGESLAKQEKPDKASVHYLRCFKKFPSGNKAPDCLYKLGVSLNALGKQKEACVTFEKLLHTFPQLTSPATEKANKELDRLKCRQPE